MESHLVADLVRVALVWVPASLVFMSSLSVLIWYSRAYTVDKEITKIYGRSVYGLLPLHVAAISLSYMGLVLLVLLHSISRLDRPLSWHTPFGGVFLWMGVFAMWHLVGFERKRYHSTITRDVA